MKFRSRNKEEPEINLIPFIDVLLVIIIFLMLTTTYSQISALQVRLPSAQAQPQDSAINKIDLVITADGTFAINGLIINHPDVTNIAQRLSQAAQGHADTIVVVNADGNASHQSVVNAMDAAKRAGLARLTFATSTPTE